MTSALSGCKSESMFGYVRTVVVVVCNVHATFVTSLVGGGKAKLDSSVLIIVHNNSRAVS